ncbi:hypothetical protein IH992_08190 [Candidatus Poribacteria bacterium]|nr:hypothetical protein [Candidatus Poribacteria bacterium]
MKIWNRLIAHFPAIKTARQTSLRPYAALIAVAGFSIAIALGLEIRTHLNFQHHNTSGVVGWVSVHQYPKQQEFFFYLFALVGVPSAICVYWFGWIGYSSLVAKWTNRPVDAVLKAHAFAALPLLLIWRDIYHLDRSWVVRLALPIGLSIIAKLGFLLFYILRPSVASSSTPPESVSFPPQRNRLPLPRILSLSWVGVKYLAFPVSIYLLMYSGHIHGKIDLFHEGERLAPLNEMLHGGIAFRDVYVQHGLFQNIYLPWFASKVFGPTLEGVRRMERLLDPLGYVALYLLGLQVFRGGIVTSLILVTIASGENFWVSPRHGLGLISFALVANYLTHHRDVGLFAGWQRIQMGKGEEKEGGKKNGRLGRWFYAICNTHHISRFAFCWTFGWRLVLAGIITSLAFWYSTEIGLYSLGGIGLFLLMYSLQRGISGGKRPLPLICYGGGALVGFWIVGVYFFLHGTLDDAIWNTYIQCGYQLETWGLAFPSLAATLKPLADTGLRNGWREFVLSESFRWFLPVFIFLVAAAYLTYRWLRGGFWHADGCMKLLLLLLGGIAFFRTALGRSDGGHLTYGATFLWLLCVFPADRSIGRIVDHLRLEKADWKPRLIGACKSAWVILPMLAALWYAHEVHHPIRTFQGKWGRLMNNPFAQKLVPEKLERAGNIDIPDEQAEHIKTVVAYIQRHTARTEKIFDFTSQGAYYFFANRPSVTRFHQVAYASTPEMQQEVIDALERNQTQLVIFKTGGWFDNIDGITSEKRHPLIAQYLRDNYELAININGTQILMRKSSAARKR